MFLAVVGVWSCCCVFSMWLVCCFLISRNFFFGLAFYFLVCILECLFGVVLIVPPLIANVVFGAPGG